MEMTTDAAALGGAGRTLLIDNYDSFTYNLLHILRADTAAFGETVLVRNDEFADWESLDAARGPFARVVLSPGPGNPLRPSDFGLCRDAIEQSALPVLGVCLGHQGIGAALGARVVRAAAGPMHGRLERVTHSDDGAALFAGVPVTFTAVRYHSLELEPSSLPPCLRATAWASDGRSVMAVQSADGRLHGLQFHPESICSEHGARLLRNFAAVRAEQPAPPRAPARPPAGGAERARAEGPREGSVPPAPSVPLALLVEEVGGELARTVAADPADAFVHLYGARSVAFWLDSASRCGEQGGERGAGGEGGSGRGGSDEPPRPHKRQAQQPPGTEPAATVRAAGHEGDAPAALRAPAMAARCSLMGSDGGRLAQLLAIDADEDGAEGRGGESAFDRLGAGLGRYSLGAAPGAGSAEAVLRCEQGATAEAGARTEPWPAGLPLPFGLRGGYVGYLGYELRHDSRAHDAKGTCAPRPPQPAARAPRADHVPDACVLFADRFLAVDHGREEGEEQGTGEAGAMGEERGGAPRLFMCHLVRRDARAEAEAARAAQPGVRLLAGELQSAAAWFRQTRADLQASAGAAGRLLAESGAAPLGAGAAAAVPAASVRAEGGMRFRADRSRCRYAADVRACLDEISAGESYEVCLTNQFRAPLPAARRAARGSPSPTAAPLPPLALSEPLPPLALYLHLRTHNPAPNGAFLLLDPDRRLPPNPGTRAEGAEGPASPVRSAALAVLCSSPERMLHVCAQQAGMPSAGAPAAPARLVAECKPIKGTAPRGRSGAHDAALAQRLSSCEKERSENLMIVDLVRNDLARVCLPGSVHVPLLMAVESYRTVHQLVSTVRGTLRAGASALDALAASFPGGSMTGAPKVRTLQIIHTRERAVPRGVYAGGLGYLSLGGTADVAIVIRTAVLTPEGVAVGAGGAVTALSEPAAEYAEMRLKAAPVLAALARALGGEALVDDSEDGEEGSEDDGAAEHSEAPRAAVETKPLPSAGSARAPAAQLAARPAPLAPREAENCTVAVGLERASAQPARLDAPRARSRSGSSRASTLVADGALAEGALSAM